VGEVNHILYIKSQRPNSKHRKFEIAPELLKIFRA